MAPAEPGNGTEGAPAGQDAGETTTPRRAPREVLRAWDAAEARLFPLVMARPELYQRALAAIERLLGRLREDCPDLGSLLAAQSRGGALVADDQADWIAGIDPDLIAAAACAMRYRELLVSLAAGERKAALAQALADGLEWAVVAETGSPDQAPYVPYQRVEAEVATGRAVIVSIEPDETLSRAVHRVELGQVELATGALRITESLGSFHDPDEAAAIAHRAKHEHLH
jgi:hypothetical protein